MRNFWNPLRMLTAALAPVVLLAVPAVASATTGEMSLTSNRTLTEDHYGTITFNANDITLDCQMHVIRPHSSVGNLCNGAKCGIRAINRSNITIRNCRVQDFSAQVNGIDSQGIFLSGSNNILVDNTYCDRNGEGLRATNVESLECNQCYMRTNTAEGFDINDTSWSWIHDSTTAGNGSDGIDLENGGWNTLDRLYVYDNSGNGIEQDGGQSLWIRDCVISENSANGISFDDCYGDGSSDMSGALISGNEINNSRSSIPGINSWGMRLNNVGYFRIENNISYSNEDGDGYLDDGENMTVLDNYFSRCNNQMRAVAGSQCGS